MVEDEKDAEVYVNCSQQLQQRKNLMFGTSCKALEQDIYYDKISSLIFVGDQVDLNNEQVITLCERQTCFMKTFKFWAKRRGVSIFSNLTINTDIKLS